MAAPVWLLSVDLQTKTASFTTGLNDAARQARGAFNDIGAGAETMGERSGHSFGSLRSNLGLIDNTIRGAHAQAMADLVRMFSQSRIVMAALPIAATAAGFVMLGGLAYELAQKVKELRLAQEKLTDDTLRFGTAADTAYRGLEDRLLSAQQHTDELRNDHFAALQKQLELIDHQSMGELVKSLESVAKTTDEVFKDLESHWYTFWQGGSAGAKHSLDEFKVRYEALLATGNDADASKASDMLSAKLERETKILAAQKAVAASNGENTDASFAARLVLQRMGADYSKKDIEAQEQLVNVLQRQAANQEVITRLKNQDTKNAQIQTAHTESQLASAAARESAQSMLQMGQSSIAADRATADAKLTIQEATLEQRLASDLDFAQRDEAVKLAANKAEIAALDKSGKDYQNQLKALQDKALTIQQEYATKTATLKAAESVAANDRDLQALRLSEREKIEATQQGTTERLAAIDAAIKDEQSHHLQQTQEYRNMVAQRAQVAHEAAQDEMRDRAKAAHDEAADSLRMGELAVAAERQKLELKNSTRRVSYAQEIADEIKLADEEFNIRQKAIQKEERGVDTAMKDGLQKLRELQNQEKELVQQHENDITRIKEKAEIERNLRIRAAEDQFRNAIAQGLASSIMGHQTWARMLQSLSNQVVSGMIENAIRSMLALDMTKEKEAAAAARKGFNWGLQYGGPAAPVLAPVMAAAAFTSVMAFATGTEGVPGIGNRDTVPAMLTPGEGIIPGGVMDGLRHVARNGGFQQRPNNVVQFRPTYNVQTIDSDGWGAALEKHADQTQQHITDTLRRMNK